jgi:hypothetical protein
LTLSSGTSKTTNPDADGNYGFDGLEEGNHTITPSLEKYYFFPASYSYTPLDSSQINRDFTGLHERYDGDGNGIPDWIEMTSSEGDNDEEKNYQCFLKMLFPGTPMSGGIKGFRGFRDTYLCTNPVGRIFVNSYYKISPNIATFIREHPVCKIVARGVLRPLIWIYQH